MRATEYNCIQLSSLFQAVSLADRKRQELPIQATSAYDESPKDLLRGA